MQNGQADGNDYTADTGGCRSIGSGPVALPPSARMAIVASRYNPQVTERLLDAAIRVLETALPRERIDIARVPGSFELPLIADRLAASGRYAAVICLGAIIRGETSHDRHIAMAVSTGIEAVGRKHGLPVIFGVLTCDSPEQALARAGVAEAGRVVGNKGEEAATTALEMVSLSAAIER
jgi:6,7-dimethyl-8-ribityllumazine synthase